MKRGGVLQAFADIVSFAKIIASSVGASGSPQLNVQVSDDDEIGSTAEWWGHPAINCRPLPGGEAFVIDLSGEQVVIAAKERRWQIAIEQGDCVVRALGPPPAAFIKLKPDGSIELHGTVIKLGGETAPESVPLDSLLQTNLAAIAAALATVPVTYAPTPTASAVVKASS